MNETTTAQKDRIMDQKLQEKFFNPEENAARKKRVRRGFCIALVVLLFASVLNWGVVTGWGNVEITRLTLEGADATKFSALLYVPSNASDATPAPAIICFHGNAGNARNHESWAVEFSRRGFVVLSVDQFGAGNSNNNTSRTMYEEGMMPCAELYFNYLIQQPFVDRDKIISSGHSMGSSPAIAMGTKYGVSAIICASPAALGVMGDRYAPDFGEYEHYAGLWDAYEGNYMDVNGAVETSRIKNLYESYLLKLKSRDFISQDAETYEFEHIYGSFDAGNVFLNTLDEKRIHEAAFVNATTIGKILWFAQESIGHENVPNYIDSADQIWQVKDFTGLFGMLAFAAFLCALALLLIEEIPAFAVVRQPLPRNIGLRKVGMAISLVCAVVFPYIVLKTGCFGLMGAIGTNTNPIWRMGFSNMAFTTIIGLNLMGALTLILFIFTDGKKAHCTMRDFGLTEYGKSRPSLNFVGKSFFLSMVVIAIGWAYLQLQENVFGTDFYGWFFGFKPIPTDKIRFYLGYIVVWIICFVIASFSINVERRLPTTGNENLDTVLAVAFNILVGVFTVTLIIIVKWNLESNGIFDNRFWEVFGTDIQRLWGMPVGMTIGIGGSTFLYRKTGNTWLSAFLMGTVAALMCVLYGQTRFAF